VALAAATGVALNEALTTNGPKVARTLPLEPNAPSNRKPNDACDCSGPGPTAPLVNRKPGRSVLKTASNAAIGGKVLVLVVVDEVVEVEVNVVVDVVVEVLVYVVENVVVDVDVSDVVEVEVNVVVAVLVTVDVAVVVWDVVCVLVADEKVV
jgi:hypothetical protein